MCQKSTPVQPEQPLKWAWGQEASELQFLYVKELMESIPTPKSSPTFFRNVLCSHCCTKNSLVNPFTFTFNSLKNSFILIAWKEGRKHEARPSVQMDELLNAALTGTEAGQSAAGSASLQSGTFPQWNPSGKRRLWDKNWLVIQGE